MSALASPGTPLHWWPLTIAPLACDRWQTRLPNGIAVHLIGVAENPSHHQNWWKPDGSPLERAPYEQFGVTVTPQINHLEREFAIRLSDPPPQPISVQWRFGLPMGGWSGPAVVREPAFDDPTLHAAAVPAWADRPEITLRVGIAAGRWRTIAKEAASGDGAVIMTVEQPIDSSEEQIRIVARRPDGGIDAAPRCWTRKSGHLWQINAQFPSGGLKDIQRFELQCRAYEWVEFRNVALWPG